MDHARFLQQEAHALAHMRQYDAKLRELFPDAQYLQDEVIIEYDPHDEETQRKLAELESFLQSMPALECDARKEWTK